MSSKPTYKDYYALVRRYNPQAGWFAHKRNQEYARQFEADELSVSQTIRQLIDDKSRNARYVARKNRPSNRKKEPIDRQRELQVPTSSEWERLNFWQQTAIGLFIIFMVIGLLRLFNLVT